MKISSTWLKYFNLYFSETLNFADFNICIQIFHIFLRSKVTVLWSGSILSVFAHFLTILSLLCSLLFSSRGFDQNVRTARTFGINYTLISILKIHFVQAQKREIFRLINMPFSQSWPKFHNVSSVKSNISTTTP